MVSSLMAQQPFSRTGYGHALMENMIRPHKLNFDYQLNAPLGPSQEALDILQKQKDSSRVEAQKFAGTGRMLYNGHSSFANTFYSDKRDKQAKHLETAT